MCGPILLLALLLPPAELVVFIHVGGTIGALEVVALILLTGISGIFLARRQGLKALDRLRRGATPRDAEVLEAPLLLLGALLLLAPGFITDGVGAILMVPPLRHLVANLVVRRFGQSLSSGVGPTGRKRSGDRDENDEDVIVINRR